MGMELGGVNRPRRIVTGLRADGTSHAARVEEVDEIDYAFGYSDAAASKTAELYRIWAEDAMPLELPVDGLGPTLRGVPDGVDVAEALRTSGAIPDPEGMRVTYVKFLPRTGERVVQDFHWHDSLAVQWVLWGSLEVVFDDGSSEMLRTGDVVVQTGTNHAWAPTEEGALLGLVVLGARRAGATPPESDRI